MKQNPNSYRFEETNGPDLGDLGKA